MTDEYLKEFYRLYTSAMERLNALPVYYLSYEAKSEPAFGSEYP